MSDNNGNGHHTINAADLTLKQLDDIARLVRQFKWGEVVATAYVYLKATDPGITRAQVEQLRAGDVTIIRDPNDDTSDVEGTAEVEADPLGTG
jgi:hypothetical protein